MGWVLTTDTKANFVGTREELIAQRTAEEAKARSTVNRGMSLSGLDQGLMAGSSGGGSSSRGSRGSPSPAAFMSPRTAAGAAMSASQDTFRCTLDKNKKVVLTVGSVGVQIFNVGASHAHDICAHRHMRTSSHAHDMTCLLAP